MRDSGTAQRRIGRQRPCKRHLLFSPVRSNYHDWCSLKLGSSRDKVDWYSTGGRSTGGRTRVHARGTHLAPCPPPIGRHVARLNDQTATGPRHNRPHLLCPPTWNCCRFAFGSRTSHCNEPPEQALEHGFRITNMVFLLS